MRSFVISSLFESRSPVAGSLTVLVFAELVPSSLGKQVRVRQWLLAFMGLALGVANDPTCFQLSYDSTVLWTLHRANEETWRTTWLVRSLQDKVPATTFVIISMWVFFAAVAGGSVGIGLVVTIGATAWMLVTLFLHMSTIKRQQLLEASAESPQF